MLLDLRQTQHSYIIRIIFLGLIGSMFFGAMLSAILGGGNNPILLKSSVGEIRRQDLYSRSQPWHLIFQHLSQKSHDDVPQLLNQYLLPKIYEDLFSHYGFHLSDRLAWSLFLKMQFDETPLTAEHVEGLKNAIKERYGSQAEFLKQLKVQIHTMALKQSLQALGQPLSSPHDLSHMADRLQRHAHIYTYLPQDFYAQLPEPQEQELLSYYEAHTQNYVKESSISLEYFLLNPSLMLLPQEDSSAYKGLVEQLQSRGYEEITPALLQQAAYHALLEEIGQWEQQDTLSEAQQRLAESGVAIERLSVQKLSDLNQDNVDDLFSQPGLYQVMEMVYLSYQQPSQHYNLDGDQELFAFVTEHQKSGVQPYEDVALAVLQDWKNEHALSLVHECVQQKQQEYLSGLKQETITGYHHHKDLIINNLYADRRLDDPTKVALSALYDPRLDSGRSTVLLESADKDHVSFIVMQELSYQKDPMDSETDADPFSFKIDEFAQQELFDKTVQIDLNRNFGYEIVHPDFWTYVERSA